jgi:hypothetical protein
MKAGLPGHETMFWTTLKMHVAVSSETSVSNGVNKHGVVYQRTVIVDT